MSEPIVFISHFTIKYGSADDLRQLTQETTADLEAAKPRTLAFLSYVDDGEARMTIVHVFGDAAAMTLHFGGAADRSRRAYELMRPAGWEIYGRPDQAVIEQMREAATQAGVTLRIMATYAGGFLRLASA